MQKYLITSPEFYTDIPAIFTQKLHEQIKKHKPEYILYRDKETKSYENMAKVFLDVVSEYENIKAFLHTDVKLAKELNAYGVHLPSTAFNKIKEAKKSDLSVIVSTHTKEEIIEVDNLGADYVTYSPIFTTPNKGKPKGIDDLKNILSQTKIKVFALGGITTKKEINELKKTSVYGFASIRYFQ